MNVKEILVDLTLFNSLINRAIYNQCEIVLFDESKPEKFEAEIADLASRHADTVTVYKSLSGKTMFASDLHFNPYNVKVIANVHKEFEGKFTDLLDDKGFELVGKKYYITNVRYTKDLEEIKVFYTEDIEGGDDKSSYLDSFYHWLNNNESTFKSEDFTLDDLKDLWNEMQQAEEEKEEFKNQPEYGTDLGILKAIDEFSGDIESIYKDYSGRGMYGAKCFGIVVPPYSGIEEELEKYDVMGSRDNMGRDMIIYWPGKTFESLKAKDEHRILDQFDDNDDESEANADEYALKPLIKDLEDKGYMVIDEGSHQDITLYVANSKEEFADDIFLALIFGNEELVDIVDSNFQALYAGKYAEVEEIAKKHEKKSEASHNKIQKIMKELEAKFDLHPGAFHRETETSVDVIGHCGCHDTLMDSNGRKMWGYEFFNPELTEILHNNGAWSEIVNPEMFTIYLNDEPEKSDDETEAVRMESLGSTEITPSTRFKFVDNINLPESNEEHYHIYVDVMNAYSGENDSFCVQELIDDTGLDIEYYQKHLPKLIRLGMIKVDNTSEADAGDCYKIIKQPLDVSATSFAQQMVFEALESSGGEACESEIKKVIDDKELWGYYQKSNPGTLRRARENPDLIKNGLEELIKDGYVALEGKSEASGKKYDFKTMKAVLDGKTRPMRIDNEASMIDIWYDEQGEWIWSEDATDEFFKRRGKMPTEALHPEQKGGQEIKLRKIAEKYIDEVAKHANTGIVQHAILDPNASDLNKEQISSIRKALVEVGNRNMGNDRVRKEGKEGVIAGSDIAEWASWLTSDCMAFTADYLMESIGSRNAKDTYAFAKAKLEDCLMDFYRNEMNKSNYEEIYAFWEDLIYGQKAFGASESDDFFTVYLMKEKTPEEMQSMCKSVEEQFKTECAIVDNSAFNVYKLGNLKANEMAMDEVASFIGQSEVLEMA